MEGLLGFNLITIYLTVDFSLEAVHVNQAIEVDCISRIACLDLSHHGVCASCYPKNKVMAGNSPVALCT